MFSVTAFLSSRAGGVNAAGLHWWTYFQVYFRLTNKVGNTDPNGSVRLYLLYLLYYLLIICSIICKSQIIEQIITSETAQIRISNFISESEIHLEIRPPVRARGCRPPLIFAATNRFGADAAGARGEVVLLRCASCLVSVGFSHVRYFVGVCWSLVVLPMCVPRSLAR